MIDAYRVEYVWVDRVDECVELSEEDEKSSDYLKQIAPVVQEKLQRSTGYRRAENLGNVTSLIRRSTVSVNTVHRTALH